MHIDRAYANISWFFDAWVRLMESHTRLMEVRDSDLGNASILIVSAPTDRGIAALSQANCRGESYLLCFSDQIEAIAQHYFCRHEIENVSTVVAPFFSIPVGSEELHAIYANCLVDLCDSEEVSMVLAERWRALKRGGCLYSVHMGMPSRTAGRAWGWLFRRFPALSQGFHPVSLVPSLLDRGFTVIQDRAPGRFGFPLRYVEAHKRKVA